MSGRTGRIAGIAVASLIALLAIVAGFVPIVSAVVLQTDGKGTCATNLTATTCTITFTTSNAKTVLIVGQADGNVCNAGCPGTTQIAPSDSHTLTWTKRQCAGPTNTPNQVCTWWATWSSSGSITITCNFQTHTTNYNSCQAFGVDGADTTSATTIFDQHAGIPCSEGTNAGAVSQCTFTLSTASNFDYVFGVYGCIGDGTHSTCATAFPTQLDGFASLGTQGSATTGCTTVDACAGSAADFDILGQNGQSETVGFSTACNTGNSCGFIGDAIQNAGISTTITSTATSTITGANLSDPPNLMWLWLIPLFFAVAYVVKRSR